jgi:EmrB/QacA subfamily drug resistance transporter
VPDVPPRQHYNVTLAILTIAGIAFSLQQTMVVPALPALQRDLHTSTAWVTWLLTVFLLTASVATPILGKLGDQYGKERLLVISLGVFFAGSVAAALAPNIWLLIAARALQGTGGAIFPLSFSIIKDEFPAEKVGVAVGVVSSVFAVGGGLGLVLSGVIVDHVSWRFLFVVGAVAVGAAAVLVHRFVPESPIKTPTRLDWRGAILLSGGLVCLLVALTEGETWGWGSRSIEFLFAAAAVLLAAWVVVELRVPEPMVDIRMLALRPVLFANLTALIAGFALFGSWVLIPNFVEVPRGLPADVARLAHYGFGATTTEAGLFLLPGALAGFASGPLAGVLGRRYGSKYPLSLGMALGSLGVAILALWHDRPWHILLGMTLLGGGFPFTFAAMAKLIVDAVRPTETGVATGMNTVMRTVGGVVGGQVGAAILTADRIDGTAVPAESAFVTMFWLSAATALVAAVVALFATRRNRGVRRMVAAPEAAE